MWRKLGMFLVASLSCTDIALAHFGRVPITPFLIAVGVGAIMVLFAWPGRFRTHGMFAVGAWMLANTVMNFEAAKPTSVAYSVIYMVGFALVMNCREHVSRADFEWVLRLIIVAYLVNTVITQFLVAAGTGEEFLGEIFHRNTDLREDVGLRYFGFSSEPSYAAIIVGVAFVAGCELRWLTDRKALLTYSVLTAYQLWAFSSIYGYLIGGATAAWIAYRLLRRVQLLALGGLVAALLVVASTGEGRVGKIVEGLSTNGVPSLLDLSELDSSTFMRIAPTAVYLSDISLRDQELYFGRGAMQHTLEFTTLFEAALADNFLFEPGFFPGYLYDFGIIGVLLVLVILCRASLRGVFTVPTLIVIATLFNANFNTQLFWYVFVVFAYVKSYRTSESTAAST